MLRLSAAILFIFSCSVSVLGQTTVQDYVNKYNKTAISQMERTGVPASILLSMGILESLMGNSQLALQANNHFSIKCEKNWDGEFFYQWEKSQRQKPSCYRVYEVAEESFIEFTNYLKEQNPITNLLSYNDKNYKSWAIEIGKMNLSERLSNPDQMIRLIEAFDLATFDNTIKKEAPKYITRKIHVIHRLKAIVATPEDTPLGIASEFNISYRKVLKYNDLDGGEGFKAGQFVFLEAKRNHADIGVTYHELRNGETMYDISQLYAIRLKTLLKLNKVGVNEQIADGERIYLAEEAPVRPRLMGERIKPTSIPRAKDSDIAVNKNAPGGRDKIKYRPQRKIVPQLNTSKPQKEDMAKVDDKKENDGLGFIDKNTSVKIEKPRIEPTKKEKAIVINEVQPGNQLENIPGQSSSELNLDKKDKEEGAPIPIFPTGTKPKKGKKPKVIGTIEKTEKPRKTGKTSGQVSDLPPGRKTNKSNSAIISNTSIDEVLEEEAVKVARKGYYIVLEDDTLYSIARRHNTTVEAIRYWNGLRGNEIEIGQELKITGRN
jgi:LysM repeat protein